MARRLATIARHINESWPGYTAKVKKVTVSTDRKLPGSRLIWPGKGRTGNRLTVTEDATGREVYRHDSAESYARNEDVEAWVERIEAGRGNLMDRLQYLPGREAKRIAYLEVLLTEIDRKLSAPDDYRPDQLVSFGEEADRLKEEIAQVRATLAGGSEPG